MKYNYKKIIHFINNRARNYNLFSNLKNFLEIKYFKYGQNLKKYNEKCEKYAIYIF